MQTESKVHNAYDGLAIRASHLGRNVTATARWAWDDWYYIVVSGTFDNGNAANGVYCREQAATVRQYLINPPQMTT